MKTENRNAEQYLAPEVETMDILSEGVFCSSVEDGGMEGGGSDGEIG